VPDTTYWTKWGSGDGSVLADYVDSVNEMSKAFHAKFKKKMRSSGIRSFRQQYINRAESVRKGNCRSITTAGCSTAIPGTSNHGWGMAIDVRKPEGVPCGKNNSACFIKFDKYHDWLLENAYEKGFAGIKWGWLGMKGEKHLATRKLKEPWHWEPITDRVMVLL
jgi:LAS superfamily LD-carboxypeptidase LdcB